MTRLMKKYQAPVLIFLLAAAISGVVLLVGRRSEPVEVVIASPEVQPVQGTVYVSGAVASPGLYPWREGDTLADILQAAGLPDRTDGAQIKVHVPATGELPRPQRVNLNTAEEWLLEALPGIGETRAGAIIEYRKKEGPFRSAGELTKVKGIGVTTYESIKDLITVAD
jgi:competence protein ComEA